MRFQKLWMIALCGAAPVAALRAQTIQGAVVDGGDRPVGGVVVLLLDSASTVVARSLTSDAGAFRVSAGRAGQYRVRTMRIGYRPTTTEPIALMIGSEVTRRIILAGAQVQLDTVRVVDRSSCSVDAAGSAATFAVFDQARTALSAAQLTVAGRAISATTLSYDRLLEPDGRRVRQQSSRLRTELVSQPWRSVTPADAHRAGFVAVARDNSVTYFAPSIDVLLSSAFVEDHCFRLVDDKREPGSVGVAFEPSKARRELPELRGTMWIDRKSAELRKLEYRYVNVSPEQESAGAGGEVAFARLTNGGWVISRWSIRMPVLEQVVRTQQLGGIQTHVVGVQVAGGEVVLATRATSIGRDTLWSRPPLTLAGTVVDSATNAPVANAHVDLVGAALGASTDARGRFSITGVLPGTYVVETRTAELEAIGAANQSSLDFSDSTVSYQIRVPKASQLASAVCAGRTLAAGDAVLLGRVFQRGDTIPAAGASVVAEWTVVGVAESGTHLERNGRRLEGKTTAEGAFRLCGVPTNTVITVTASNAGTTGSRNVRPSGIIARTDIVMDRDVKTTATFAGRVVTDSTSAAIEGAEIYFPDLSKLSRSGVRGEFRVDEIPSGAQHVVVRRLGFAPLDTMLSFAADKLVDRQVVLTPVRLLDSVVVTDRLTLRIMQDFEDNRRIGLGTFLDRSQLEAQQGQRLAQMVAQWPGMALPAGKSAALHSWPTGTRHGPPPCPFPTRECLEGHGFWVPDPHFPEPGLPGTDCYAQVYVDDVLMNHGFPTPPYDVSTWHAEQLEGVEWFPSQSATPSRYAGREAHCGVLVLHTRRTP